ncbi:MAG: hypothetical protein QXJ64_08620, partial [Thermosphaera sp.]
MVDIVRLTGLNKNLFLLSIIAFTFLITILILIIIFLNISRGLGGRYLDEEYYIESGLKYVRCFLPAYFNPEHPPLGKYL